MEQELQAAIASGDIARIRTAQQQRKREAAESEAQAKAIWARVAEREPAGPERNEEQRLADDERLARSKLAQAAAIRARVAGRKAEQAAEEQSRKARAVERLKLEKSAAAAGKAIVTLWEKLLGTLDELDRTEVRLKEISGLRNSCPPTDSARERIKKDTDGAITFREPRHPADSRGLEIRLTKGAREYPLPVPHGGAIL